MYPGICRFVGVLWPLLGICPPYNFALIWKLTKFEPFWHRCLEIECDCGNTRAHDHCANAQKLKTHCDNCLPDLQDSSQNLTAAKQEAVEAMENFKLNQDYTLQDEAVALYDFVNCTVYKGTLPQGRDILFWANVAEDWQGKTVGSVGHRYLHCIVLNKKRIRPFQLQKLIHVLLHEMVHALDFTAGYTCETHGFRFQRRAGQLATKLKPHLQKIRELLGNWEGLTVDAKCIIQDTEFDHGAHQGWPRWDTWRLLNCQWTNRQSCLHLRR